MPHLNPAAAAAICARPEADFILGSVHNLSPERGGTDLFFLDFSTVQACYDALDDYLASLALLAATDFYDVLAHLIYPLRYMQAPVTLNRYQDAIRAILRTAVEKGRGMEVNTCRGRTLEEWRPILALYRDCGGEIVTVGSDAHTPADVGKGVRAACALLRECGYPPKSVARNGSFITYFKQSDQIEDFLTLIGAPVAAMSVMSAKLEKDLRNSVNRRQNCDSANLDKAVEAAQEQLEAIRRLRSADLLDKLPDKLKKTAALRLEYPELSLSELAAAFDPPVTKSCLNHLLLKIQELAKTL